MLSVRYRVMDARGKFGEHERGVRVVRGPAESNSSFLSALQNSPSASITRYTKIQILSENVDKQSQNTHLEVNIFARQKSKARSRVRIFQNIFTLPKLN